jgi:ATP-dependent DNA helicase RecG
MSSHHQRLDAAHAAIARVLDGEVAGTVETETLDFTEDPTRRGPHGQLQAGATQDDGAARYFADEAACMANHEGGVLVAGVDDKGAGAGAFVGTALRASWLRARIRELTTPPLVVGVETIETTGSRLLVLSVPRNPGPEPHAASVSKRGRRIARRVGTGCHELVGIAELVAWAQERNGYDWSAGPSEQPLAAARPGALDALRDVLRESREPARAELAELDDESLLRRLQLLRDDGTLTRAGALLTCPGPSPQIVYLHRSAPGAPSVHRVERAGRGLAEELQMVLDAIEARNRQIAAAAEHAARGVLRAIPPDAIREALVNAIMHRDWDRPDPIVVDHVDDQLVVFSPGGFFGGVSERTVLTAASRTRNRLLGDALRSLRLAEREGTGVDRMYIELIRLGHAPPTFAERDEGVRVTLNGGDPVPEVLEAHAALPRALRDSARVAVAIHLLRERPSITLDELAEAAQEPADDLEAFVRLAADSGVLKRTANPRPGGVAAWRLSDELRAAVGTVLPYFARPAEESMRLIERLAREQGSVRNQDVQDLLGVNSPRASQLLRRTESDGRIRLAPGARPTGRGTFYVPAGSGEKHAVSPRHPADSPAAPRGRPSAP